MYFRKGVCMAGALASTLALGCASQKSNTDSASNESFSQIRQQELASEREEFIADHQEQLEQLDTEISRLETRLEHEAKFVDAEQKAEWSQELFELRQQQRQARGELERARNASPEEWAEMRSGLGYAVDTLQAAVNKTALEISQLFTSDDNPSERTAARAGSNVDLCMIQVDGTSATVLEQGDELVVRLTTRDESELDELRERAEQMSRQVSESSRAMAPGERATGDTSVATDRSGAEDTRAVAPGGRATGDRSDVAPSEDDRAALIEDVRVEHIDDGVRVIFQPMEGRRTALRQQLEDDVARIENRDCG